MHELGVLMATVKTVTKIAQQNNINKVKHITLEVGERSPCKAEWILENTNKWNN